MFENREISVTAAVTVLWSRSKTSTPVQSRPEWMNVEQGQRSQVSGQAQATTDYSDYCQWFR